MKFQKGDKVLVTKAKELGVIHHAEIRPKVPWGVESDWYYVCLQPEGESPYFSWFRESALAFPRNGLDFVFDYLDAKGL